MNGDHGFETWPLIRRLRFCDDELTEEAAARIEELEAALSTASVELKYFAIVAEIKSREQEDGTK